MDVIISLIQSITSPCVQTHVGLHKVFVLSVHNRIGECQQSFTTAPIMKACMHILVLTPKEGQKKDSKQLRFGFKVFLLPIALPQGRLKEVPIHFKNFTIKVVGQTIVGMFHCYNEKVFKWNNQMRAGQISWFINCNLALHKSQKVQT